MASAVTFGLFIKEYVLSVTKPNMMSQIPRDIGPKCKVQPKEVKTKANTDRSRKRKVRWTRFSTTEDIPLMPYHIQGGENVGSQTGHVMPENQSERSCTGSDMLFRKC